MREGVGFLTGVEKMLKPLWLTDDSNFYLTFFRQLMLIIGWQTSLQTRTVKGWNGFLLDLIGFIVL
jgi:hypothetical protein